jgi:NADPH:quinone reductase-like Zn-dependent oxidoreductase
LYSEAGPLALNMWLALLGPLLGRKRVRFPFPLRTHESLRLAGELLAADQLDPVIDRRHPVEQLPDAFRYVETRRKAGNVVLTVR